MGRSPIEGGESPIEGGRSPIAMGRSPIEGGESPIEIGESPVEGGTSPIETGKPPVDSGMSYVLTAGARVLTEGAPGHPDAVRNDEFTKFEFTNKIPMTNSRMPQWRPKMPGLRSGFPRSSERGPIEAFTPPPARLPCGTFPRSSERGPIEALPPECALCVQLSQLILEL
jgi:hypothetical protein